MEVDVCRLWCSLTDAEQVLALAIQQQFGDLVNVTVVGGANANHAADSDQVIH